VELTTHLELVPSSIIVELFIYSPPLAVPVLEPTELPIQWLMELFPRGYSGLSVALTTHLDLVPRSRILELFIYSPPVATPVREQTVLSIQWLMELFRRG
jgi:hypothetical protein